MELLAPVRVVVVDDRPDHLFAIANALVVSGVPCLWHLYNKDTHQLVPPPPKGGYPDIRLLVTDLNIRNATGAGTDAKTLAGILIEDVLLPLLPTTQCPYGLMLWTNVEGKSKEVGEVISDRIDHANVDPKDRRSAPLTVQLISKNEFVSDMASAEANSDVKALITEAVSGIDAVRSQLHKALSDTQLQLACAWETRVSKAATSTINSVYSAAVIHAGEESVDKSTALSQIFAKLAFEASGKEDAREAPSRALDDGLVDLLVDDLRSTDSVPAYAEVVEASIGAVLRGRPPLLSRNVRARLNTDLHIEMNVSRAVTKTVRGLVLGADDDNLIAKAIDQKDSASVVWSEFLVPISQLNAVLKDPAQLTEEEFRRLTDLHTRLSGIRPDVETGCRLRLLEVGADCDHAQRKARTVRLLCALEVPRRFVEFLSHPMRPGKLKSEALIEFGPWNLGGDEDSILIVSVGRFFTAQTWQLPAGLTPQYRLRKPLIEVVLHKYANYSSRQGYVAVTGD